VKVSISHRNQTAIGILALAVCCSCTPAQAGAGDFSESLAPAVPADAGKGDWDIQFRPYVWTANLDGTIAIAGQSAPVDVSFDDILNNLDFIWSSTLDIRREGSDWGFFLDLTFLEISPGLGVTLPGPVSLRGLRIEQHLIDAVATYRIHRFDDGGWIDLIGGVRWQYMNSTIEFVSNVGPGFPEISTSEGWFDPHVGIRIKKYLTQKLYFAGLLDVGGFGVGADFAFAAAAGLGYHVSDSVAVETMVRYLSVDYSDGGFAYDVDTTGIFLGVAMYF
jgi:hypothetical protein